MKDVIIKNRKHGDIRFFTAGALLKAEVKGETGDVWMYSRKSWGRVFVTIEMRHNFEHSVRKIYLKFSSGYASIMKPLV